MAQDLRERAQEPICPTCARPLGAEEAERLAALLDKEIKQILEAEAALERDEQAASVQAKEAERAEAEARKRQDELISIDARLADGLQKIAEADAEHDRALDELQKALDAAGAAVAPTEAEIDDRADLCRRGGAHRRLAFAPGAARRASGCRASRDYRRRSRHRRAGPGHATTPEAHRTAQAGLERARAAATRIDQIDMELASRAQYEAQRDAAVRELASLAERRTQLESERGALGFDEARLRLAQDEEAAARGAAQDRARRSRSGA